LIDFTKIRQQNEIKIDLGQFGRRLFLVQDLPKFCQLKKKRMREHPLVFEAKEME
jgi:hypothetical protein